MAHSSIPAQFSEAELKLLQALVYQECGMHFDERRTHFLQDRLQRRLKECQLDSFYSYYRLLISKEGKAELARLLENLTVNETSFSATRPSWIVPQTHPRRPDAPQAVAAGLLVAYLERRLLHRPGALHFARALATEIQAPIISLDEINEPSRPLGWRRNRPGSVATDPRNRHHRGPHPAPSE